ncbi:helix-turn-helix transcriptional regulator [Massilia sp. BSC265]|uniref:helix-turn-helix domain-containing protein n=1 Tax=Massilia sp. BSC265 TaxID=1549812 RepID=UPI0012698DD2
MDTSTLPEENCFRSTLDSFCQSLVNAVRVARMDEHGEPAKMTQHELANRSGVARSTIAKYVAHNARSTGEINPDLETICRLAKALNVPPAACHAAAAAEFARQVFPRYSSLEN